MQTTMKVRLTKGLATYIQTATPSRTVQDLVALLVAMTIVRSRFSVHSLIIKRIVGAHRYGEYLRVMRSLPFITRSENYISRALAEKQGQQAHCKAWSYNGLLQTRLIGNINGFVGGESPISLVRRLVRWDFSSEFAGRLQSAFQWYLTEYELTSGQTHQFREIVEVVGGTLRCLEPPDLSFEEVLDICDGVDEKAQSNWEVLSKMRRLGHIDGWCRFDHGHRIYHQLTNLKKEIRQRFRMSGEPTVEVDMHATFPAIIAAKLAPPPEQDRLIAMCQSGDFYGQMAELLNIHGLDAKDMKKCFQREVVFTFRPWWSGIWQAFSREFPGTARQIAQIRDGTDTIVRERQNLDVNGRRYTTRTRWGQRRLSRILSRFESQIFLHRALLRLHRDDGIQAIPIHDCLIVAKRHAALAKRVIEQAAEEVLAFVPVVQMTSCGQDFGLADAREGSWQMAVAPVCGSLESAWCRTTPTD